MKSLERQLRDRGRTCRVCASVILTGSGRAFCAGGDLIEFEAALRAAGKLIDTLALQSGRHPDASRIFRCR